MNIMKKHVIYVDGLNVLMRHFAANPSRSLNGVLCGGIFGFLNNIKNLSEMFYPNEVVVAWEGRGSARRRSIDKNYKEGRRPVSLNRSYYNDIPDTEENRNYQLKTIIEILNNTPVKQIYVEDCEADDVISYLCKTKNNDNKNIIITSDKDYYQLINENNIIWSPNKKTLIDKHYVLKKWGISPTNFCTARCFAGDQSDGIKGAKGVGFKKLIKNFPELSREDFVSVENIINRTEEEVISGTNSKFNEAILENALDIKKNWKLMYLDSAMLSASQIKAINYQYESKDKKLYKIEILKTLNREGLNNFNAHAFCMSLKNIT